MTGETKKVISVPCIAEVSLHISVFCACNVLVQHMFTVVSYLIGWCFKPSQPQMIMSGLCSLYIFVQTTKVLVLTCTRAHTRSFKTLSGVLTTKKHGPLCSESTGIKGLLLKPEFHNPQPSNALLFNSGFQNQQLSNVPIIKPGFHNPQLSNALLFNPGFQNPQLQMFSS